MISINSYEALIVIFLICTIILYLGYLAKCVIVDHKKFKAFDKMLEEQKKLITHSQD